MIAIERKSDFKLTTYTPYLALTGELWGIYYDNFQKKKTRYDGAALYTVLSLLVVISNAFLHIWYFAYCRLYTTSIWDFDIYKDQFMVHDQLIRHYYPSQAGIRAHWPLLLTWINFNPNMDK